VDIPRGRAARAAWLALPPVRQTEAVAQAEFGRPHADPVVQRAAVGWARYLPRRAGFQFLTGVLAGAATGLLPVLAGASAVASMVVGLVGAFVGMVAAFVVTALGQRAERRLEYPNLAALLDVEPRQPAAIMRVGRSFVDRPVLPAVGLAVLLPVMVALDVVRGRSWLGLPEIKTMVVLALGVLGAIAARHDPRPPVVIGYDGLGLPSYGLVIPWAEVAACELIGKPRRIGHRIAVAWRLRDSDRFLARMPEGRRRKGFGKYLREHGGAIVIGAEAMTVRPELVVLASRAFLPVPAVGPSVGGEVDGARRRRADGVGRLGE
jgi:hypothetical protein